VPYLHRAAPRHPKVRELSDHAFRVWVAGGCYCDDLLTDGVISKAALGDLAVKVKPSDIRQLTAVLPPYTNPLWEPHDGYYLMHDYLAWNDSRATVQRNRARLRLRVQKSRDKRHNMEAGESGNGSSNGVCNPVTSEDVTVCVTGLGNGLARSSCNEGNVDRRPSTKVRTRTGGLAPADFSTPVENEESPPDDDSPDEPFVVGARR
jgi:hypothetical protein